jgi:cob(I)alamin adenosyltransferase
MILPLESEMKKGYLQVYTGNGKGKTTASLGVCLRALACGMKVFYMQFIKGGDKLSSEFEILKKFPEQFTYRSCGRGCFIFRDPEDIDIASAKEVSGSHEFRAV